jgi:hypothetical protein
MHGHPSLDDLHEHFNDRFCIFERRSDNIFWAIRCVSMTHVICSSIKVGEYDSAWRIGVLDSERLRALRIHHGVSLSSMYFGQPNLIKMGYRGLAELVSSNTKTANVTFECGWTAVFSILQLGEFLREWMRSGLTISSMIGAGIAATVLGPAIQCQPGSMYIPQNSSSRKLIAI